MQHGLLLKELAITALTGVMVALLFRRWRIPTVAGLLVAGALLGPFGLRLVQEIGTIETLAEVGVILLLFSIGLEFSLSRLKSIAHLVMQGGFLQVILTIFTVIGGGIIFGESIPRATVWGFIFAMSSTAIVMRLLTERGEIDAPHGRFIVGVLIFQDLCVIPMMLLVPVLAGNGNAIFNQLAFALGKAVLLVTLTLLVSRFAIPYLFKWVDATRSREVFLLAVLGICLGTAWLTSLVGLSLSLGAFLAGIMLADTDYQNRALTELLPLRDVFSSLFFISLGMLFDGRTVLSHPGIVLGLVLGLSGGKTVIAALAALVMRFPARATWLAGIGLAQFGEFGFVLLRSAQSHGLITFTAAQVPLAAGVISMFLTPFLIRLAPHLTAGERLLAPLARLLGARGIDDPNSADQTLSNHVIIVGYGLAGRMLGQSLSILGLPYVVLELNAETVRQAQQTKKPVYYGDATSSEALEHARFHHAQALVIMINDPLAARRIVDTARRIDHAIPIFIRTRYITEHKEYAALGASDIVCEELEAGVEILARVMRHLGIPRNVLEQQVHDARQWTQRSARMLTIPRPTLEGVEDLSGLKIESFLVQNHSHAAMRSGTSLQIRRETGALVVAIRRGKNLIEYTNPQELFLPGDLIFLIGSLDAVARASQLLEGGAINERHSEISPLTNGETTFNRNEPR